MEELNRRVEQSVLAEQFETHRKHMQAVAFRMLGSLSEADDAVQESWIRLSRSDASSIENLGGWLTTVVARVCLDMLRSRKSRREELIAADEDERILDPEEEGNPEYEAMLADSVGLALLVVLGTLNPTERITFVLHDIFNLPFTEIAPIVGRTPTAARQIASRARRRVQGADQAQDTDFTRQRQLVEAFLAASRAGDFDGLLAVLDPNVVLRDDREAMFIGGIKEIRGSQAVAKQVSGTAHAARTALVNGTLGIVVAPNGKLLFVISLTIAGGRISEFNLISDPSRLGEFDLAVLSD